jgi:FAD:protein FMN transferase
MNAVHLRRPAMATWFEMWLLGDDVEHLTAVGEAALDEIERIERLLSRFDPAAEIARVNREAARRPVKVDAELLAVLEDCRRWFEETGGFFDVAAACGVPLLDGVELDPVQRTVSFLDPRVQLDLGGYGKGYALDAAGRVLAEFGVDRALLHGGTSSVLTRGGREDGPPWPVGLRDPFAEDERELMQLRLADCGLSSSAVLGAGGETSDIVDVRQARPLAQQAACGVIAPSAVEAEVLSTALLAMGKTSARDWLAARSFGDGKRCVAWIDRLPQEPPETRVEWLAAPSSDPA